MLVLRFTEHIWPAIHAATTHVLDNRAEATDDNLRAGLNFSIVLTSACFLEGVFESALRALLSMRREIYGRVDIPEFVTRRAMNLYFARLEEDMGARIGRSTGAEGYNACFQILQGGSLSGFAGVAPLWEGLTVLFQFRNVLGHGRQVEAMQVGGTQSAAGDEVFSGGYKRVEDYLQKKDLLTARFVDCHDDYILLADEIADHFWTLVNQVPAALVSSLEGDEQDAVRKTLEPLL